MIYLLLAIISSALVSIVMRLSEQRVRSDMGMLTVNYIAGGIMAAFFALRGGPVSDPSGKLPVTVIVSVINGALYLMCFLLLKASIRKNGVVLSAAFMKLGVLVPTLLSVAVFGEIPSIPCIVGFLLALTAILMMNIPEKAEAASPARSVGAAGGLVLVALLTIGGLPDGMNKIYEQVGAAYLNDRFLLYTFISAIACSTAVMLMKHQRVDRQSALFGLILGIPNYFSARFLLWSLNTVPATIAYPMFSVTAILIISAAGVLFFREKLTDRQKAGLAIILASLVLLNM